MAAATQSLRDVLAAGVRTVRQRQGLRQEEAAARLRAHGLTSWLRGTVAQAETGSRRLSLEDLLLVALAYEVTPAELLTGADDEWVELAPEARLTLGAVRALLSGDRESVAHRDRQAVDVAATRPTTGPVRSSRFPEVLADARRFGVRRHADVDRALDSIGDSERYVARKLGTTPERVNLVALARWGRTLAEERDRRVGQPDGGEASPRQLQALRGHVTRELMTELDAELKRRRLV